MKKLYFLLVFFLVGFSASAQNFVPSSGTVRLDNWQPSNYSNQFQPSISALTVKYSFSPDSLGCRVEMSAQWNLGTTVHNGNKRYEYPLISPQEISNFGLSDLEITADVYASGSKLGQIRFPISQLPNSGSGFGGTNTQTRNWNDLLIGSSAYSAKAGFTNSTSLRNLVISKVQFVGELPFKQTLAQKLTDEAQKLERENKLNEALTQYREANEINPNNSFVVSRIRDLEQKMARYNQLVQRGNQLYDNEHFLEALDEYKQAEQELPQPQSVVAQRIAEIERKSEDFTKLFNEAERIFRNSHSTESLKKSKLQFEEALKFLPYGKQELVSEKTQKIDELLEAEYQHFMEDAQLAFEHGDWIQSGRFYVEAGKIFSRPQANQRLRISVDSLSTSLTREYQEIQQESKQLQTEFLAQTASSISEVNERCFLQNYEFQKCREKYFTDLIPNVARETNELIYQQKNYSKPKIGCFQPSCKNNSSLEVSNSAQAYFNAARRKYYLQERYKSESFEKFQNDYLDRATQLNPNYFEAYFFRAEKVEKSPTNRLIWYNKALEIRPNDATALLAKKELDKNLHELLYQAIDKDQIDEIQKALEFNLMADLPDKSPNRDFNLVEYAILKDNSPILSVFLNHRDKLSQATNSDINSLFQLAVLRQKMHSFEELLINHKPELNSAFAREGKQHDAPLILATQFENVPMVKLLLQARALPNVKNLVGRTALSLAIEERHKAIATLLVENSSTSQIAIPDVFALVGVGYAELLSSVIAKGVPINTKNKAGLSLLHASILENKPKVFSILLGKQPYLEELDNKQNTPIILASRENREEFVNELIRRKVNQKAENSLGETSLFWASKNGNENLIEQFLKSGASYEKAFRLAKKRNDSKTIDNLAREMAVLAILQNNQTYFDIALAESQDVGYSAGSGDNPLLLAAKNRKNEWFLKLSEADFQRKDANGQRAIHLAIWSKNLDLVKTLIYEFPSNRKIKNDQNVSPFHFVVASGFVEALPTLLEYSKINEQDKKGWTALHYAILNDKPEIVKALMKKGANPKIKNNDKQNAKKFANKQDKKHLKDLLK
jgi:ankyrin repeat protein